MNIANSNIAAFSNAKEVMAQSQLNLKQLSSAKDSVKAEEAAENFEAFFISKTMESMFEGIATDGMFGGGNAEKIYRSMLLDEYGKSMAKTGNVGVKDYVMRSILEMQEVESNGFIQG